MPQPSASVSNVDDRSDSLRVDDFALGKAIIRSPGFAAIDFGKYLRDLQAASGRDLGILVHLAHNVPFFLEGPRQLMLRTLAAQFLSKARVGRWEPLMIEVVDRQLDALATLSNPDLVRDFANPVFQTVTGTVLGIRDADSPEVSDWAPSTRCLLEPMLSLKKILGLQETIATMLRYIDASRLDDDPERPQPFLDWVLQQRAQDFDRKDAVALTAVLFIAGQTTSQTLCNIILAALRDPEGLRRQLASAHWVTDNLETLLRLHASPQFVDRVAQRDQEIGGCPFRAGVHVHVHLPSINRDPSRFSEDSTCPTASSLGHISFGVGPHKCPGAVYARLLIEVALPRLFARYPNLVLTVDEPEWFETTFIRAPLSLPVAP